MSNQKEWVYIAVGLLIIASLIAGSNLYTYKTVTEDYNSKLAVTNTKLELVENSLTQKIDDEIIYNTEQRKMLEAQMLSNFEQLEDSITKKTSSLKLDLESQLTTVTQRAEERGEELEGKISALSVQSTDFSVIVDDVIKSVVSIKTSNKQGSGVIYNKQGYILTNRHVVEDASTILAIDHTGEIYTAKIRALATNSDIAVLKISGNGTFSALKFADQDEIKVGSKVIAIGNPLGLSFTITEGIISAKERFIDQTGIGYIQTDVSINPGNSGGPLVNSAKKIIGINTFKITESEGLGFAIPAPIVKEIGEAAVE